ncbi:MAG: MliC family protein [Mycobacterium sp.]
MTRSTATGLVTLAAVTLMAAACGSPAPPASTPPSVTTSATAAAPPGLDCTRADGDVQAMICKDPELVGLDQQLADEFQHAVGEAGADQNALRSAQDTWRTGRDDCWKADDVHKCVLDAYRTRLVELKINDADTKQPETITYRCPDPAKPFTARFYNQFDPPAAVLTWGTDTAVVFAEQTGSGARYGRDGVDYWEHQGEVTVDFHGAKFVCKTP